MKVLIIDDEDDARVNIRYYIESYMSGADIIGEASGVKSGIELIKKTKADVVFLDIHMDDGSGFDLLDEIEVDFNIVFVTAYDQYAIKAFKYSAIDYLLKPIDLDDFNAMVKKINNSYSEVEFSKIYSTLKQINKKNKFDKMALACHDGLTIVTLKDIVNIFIENGITYINTTTENSLEVQKPIKWFLELLPTDMFFQSHQSHIVNLSCIEKLKRLDESILLSNGQLIPIARRRKEKLLAILQ